MIGENIKRLLKENGYMQKDLAKRSGLTESTISHYVNNQREPNLEALKRLALALGVSVDELIGHDYPTPALLKAWAEIDRQKAEIERLEAEIDKQYEQAEADILGNISDGGTSCHWCIDKTKQTARVEAIKEFAERLKKGLNIGCYESEYIHAYVDIIAEEMIGDQNDD